MSCSHTYPFRSITHVPLAHAVCRDIQFQSSCKITPTNWTHTPLTPKQHTYLLVIHTWTTHLIYNPRQSCTTTLLSHTPKQYAILIHLNNIPIWNIQTTLPSQIPKQHTSLKHSNNTPNTKTTFPSYIPEQHTSLQHSETALRQCECWFFSRYLFSMRSLPFLLFCIRTIMVHTKHFSNRNTDTYAMQR